MTAIGVLVQARMSSRRLPGKVLAPLAGRPMLELVLERLARAERADTVVVTTSTEPDDDPVAAFCAARDTPVFRGALGDVAGRMWAAAQAHGLEALVRISGDSPFIDQALVDRAVELHARTGAEVVTNVHPVRTFPPGQSVELLEVGALRRALELMQDAGEREHVTGAVYRHAAAFRLASFAAPEDRSGLRLVVDAPEDAALAEAVLARMQRPHWQYGWRDVVALAEAETA
jgi:spore coat polysaccharide biosynthesis protein SpsF